MFLIIDCNFLTYRAFYSFGKDAPADQLGPMVSYGFVLDLLGLIDYHRSRELIFCWDFGKGKRKEIYPDYKKRAALTEAEAERKKILANQQKILREEYLPQMGFRNIFYQWGYEADDMIAAFIESLPENKSAAIVTSDTDLYQCIRPCVSFAAPGKPPITLQDFWRKYGIKPGDWAKVKALAGCASDWVKGIPGVGNKTALKYLKGELGTHTKAYRRIVSERGAFLKRRNYRLVKLPFRGARVPALQTDEFNLQKLNKVIVDCLGMKPVKAIGP